MPPLPRRRFLMITTAVVAGSVAGPVFAGEAAKVSTDQDGVAIKGYDTHAYWSAGEPREGMAEHVVMWNGAPWRFVTAEEAALFAADPASFAPQFGGFCTRAMSFKKVVDGDPEVWRIFEGKLYLFARPVGGRKFDEGQVEMIAKAQAHWDRLHGG